MRRITSIADVWGAALTDLNFTSHPPGGSNVETDFRELTPSAFLDWHRAIHSDRLAWCWIKWQSGHAAFPSRFLPPLKNLPTDFYEEYCRLAEAAGMYTVGYTCGGDDQAAFAEHPEWFEHYGRAFACLNADPFWDREFNAVREALEIYPTRGLFFDMVRFDGACRCRFCQAAYERFYDRSMPAELDRRQFRHDTFAHWLDGALRSAREVVPDVEFCVNQQWFRKDGIPLEMLERCDWYYCEYGEYEWVGEILRAWADRPLLCGNAMQPRHVAHLAARRASAMAYDVLHDAETGRLLPVTDRRVKHWSDSLARIRSYEEYLTGAVAISHCAVLFDHERTSFHSEEDYSQDIAAHVQLLSEVNLTSTCVQRVSELDEPALARYEALFAPGLTALDPAVLPHLLRWVETGGMLYVSGLLAGENGAVPSGRELPDLPWLGVTGRRGPLRTFADIMERDVAGREPIAELIRVCDPVICTSAGATPLLYAHCGGIGRQPILWQNRLGKGRIVYLAGRLGRRLDEDADRRKVVVRELYREVICREIRRAPVVTTLAHPDEVWLNRQSGQDRLVLHILTSGAADCPSVSIRSDLIAGMELLQVYPGTGIPVSGRAGNDYTIFEFPRLPEHTLFTIPAAGVQSLV